MSFNLLLALISNVYCRLSKKYDSSLSNTARIIQVNARLTLFMSKAWEKKLLKRVKLSVPLQNLNNF